MPRDEHHVPKSERTIADHPLARLLSSWVAQFVVPALANRAAGVEIAARRWVEESAPRRRELRSRVAAEPVAALVAAAGFVYTLTFIAGRRRR